MQRQPGTIGIRREDKNRWERRSPLTPEQVSRLVEEDEVRVIVQPSTLRGFPDQEYIEAGAEMSEDLSGCNVVFGVKEMPVGFFAPQGCYAFFAHVIKGQAYNMPMLGWMMERECTLIDYEKIAAADGRRLVFFGRFAGLAGAINTLHALGLRLEHEGLHTPLSDARQALDYGRVGLAKHGLGEVAAAIAAQGLPDSLVPLVIGVAGYGHVAQGALEVLDALGAKRVEPEELPGLAGRAAPGACYCTVFREEHMVEPVTAGRRFDVRDYYDHPERYRPVFERHLPYLTALVNCIYWDKRYPRLVTRRWLGQAYGDGQPRLRVIGDVSCDVEGSIEATVRTTDSGSPYYVFDPAAGTARDGVEGRGPVIMAVDNLPCELPLGSSREFGVALMPFVPVLAGTDFARPLEELGLPPEIRRGLILHRGRLTPEFAYIDHYLGPERRGRG